MLIGRLLTSVCDGVQDLVSGLHSHVLKHTAVGVPHLEQCVMLVGVHFLQEQHNVLLMLLCTGTYEVRTALEA